MLLFCVEKTMEKNSVRVKKKCSFFPCAQLESSRNVSKKFTWRPAKDQPEKQVLPYSYVARETYASIVKIGNVSDASQKVNPHEQILRFSWRVLLFGLAQVQTAKLAVWPFVRRPDKRFFPSFSTGSQLRGRMSIFSVVKVTKIIAPCVTWWVANKMWRPSGHRFLWRDYGMMERNVTRPRWFLQGTNYIIRTGNKIFSRLFDNKELSICCSASVKICGYESSGKL